MDSVVAKTLEVGGRALVPAKFVPGVGRFAVLQGVGGEIFAVITGDQPEDSLPPEGEPQPLDFARHELAAGDVERDVAFYVDLFGWDLMREFDMGPEYGKYRIYGRNDLEYGGMMQLPPNAPTPPYWMHYIRVKDSADAAAAAFAVHSKTSS